MPEELLTTNEVAELLHVSPGTLRFWRHVGRGPVSFTLGAKVRYKADDVRRWFESQYATTAVGEAS